jgi:hypothetical protein
VEFSLRLSEECTRAAQHNTPLRPDTGFASNGKGGVDAAEFCEAVKALLYNLIGEHAARAGEVQARYNGSAEGKQAAEDDIQPLMLEICEGIVTHDK